MSSSLFLALLCPFSVHNLTLYLNFASYLVYKFLSNFQLKFKDVHLLSFGEQLKLEYEVGHVFEGCHEEPICFPPTYKFIITSKEYFGKESLFTNLMKGCLLIQFVSLKPCSCLLIKCCMRRSTKQIKSSSACNITMV